MGPDVRHGRARPIIAALTGAALVAGAALTASPAAAAEPAASVDYSFDFGGPSTPVVPGWLGISWSTATISHIEVMVFGALIVFFLIVEPRGLARLWAIGKEKLRLWPFPH